MAYSYKSGSANHAFGKLKRDIYQSDYIGKKKGIAMFCHSLCRKNVVYPSYDSKNLFNIRYNTIADNYNILHNNKHNLIIRQYSKNLEDVCIVSSLIPYLKPTPCSEEYPCTPCQNDTPVIIDPFNAILPFYNEYMIDPLGDPCGKSS